MIQRKNNLGGPDFGLVSTHATFVRVARIPPEALASRPITSVNTSRSEPGYSRVALACLARLLHCVPSFGRPNTISGCSRKDHAKSWLVRVQSYFFNAACQFITTVKGRAAAEGAGMRKRLPSEATSQKVTPAGTLNKVLGIPA